MTSSRLKIICFLYNNESPYKYFTDELIQRIASDDRLIPINCGANRKQVYDLSAIKNMHNDNIGDNISDMNLYIGEMTGMYWAWKHFDELFAGCDWIGTCHYRRFYKDIDIEDYDKFDIITTANKNIFPYPMYVQYRMNPNHDRELFDFLIRSQPEATAKTMFAYFIDPLSVFKQCNMFIMRKDLFKQYCEFIFKIIFSAYEHVNPIETLKDKTDEDKRVISFAVERMTSFWLDYMIISKRLRSKNIFDLDFYQTKPW